MRTVIFDLDGTLADTSADLIAAANACFRAMGEGDLLDPVRDQLTAFHGGRAMLRLGFAQLSGADEAMIDAYYPKLLAHYEGAIAEHTRLYPGAIDAVEALRLADIKVGICTNKPAYLAEILLKKLGIRDLFASMIGADTLPTRKPDPAPYFAAVRQAGGTVARSMLIGDTETDRKTGLAAGIPVVLVSFGPEGAGVSRLKPDALLHDYKDLPMMAEQMLGAA